MRCPLLIPLALLPCLALAAFCQEPSNGQERSKGQPRQVTGIEMAAGLTIRRIADDDLVPDCTSLAVDAKGRIIASGPGYLRLLTVEGDASDTDRVIPLCDRPEKGAHGIYAEGASIYFVGDGGIWRIDDSDGDDIADTDPIKVLTVPTGGEHDAHALRKGPDGYWYLIAGNNAESMFALQNVSTTQLPNPRAGAIWRISPDWSQREVWAHGFRNAYDFDFGPDHTIDTFDSDGERDVSLPWYRPTRVFRVRQGDDAGWMTRSWKRPDIDPQMPSVLAQFGRGSPTGVLRAPSGRLSARFHDGLFVLDWTFGRVLFVSDQGETELVAKPIGTTGFAVTDIDALPDGRLVISVGGRGSRGGIYLIDTAGEPQGSHRLTPSSSGNPRSESATAWKRRIAELRSRQMVQVDQQAAELAVSVLSDATASRSDQLAATTLLIESVGGLGAGDPKDPRGKTQVAAVFDSCRSRLRPQIDPPTAEAATRALIAGIESKDRDIEWKNELIRALAVLEPDSRDAFDCVMTDLHRVDSPVDKLHRLIALARLPVKRSDAMTEQIAVAMLQIPRLIQQSGRNVDRNWAPRLGELFVALEHRDSLLPSRLVASSDFGQPADLVWTERMDPENLERARQKMLAQSPTPMDPRIARFIAKGHDAVQRPVIREWLQHPETQSAGWLAIANDARIADIPVLREAALSVDLEARDAARAALQRLGEPIPNRTTDSQAIQHWLTRADAIAGLSADTKRGESLFQQRQCDLCHRGVKAIGPSLEGVGKRFGTEDLFRSTVDPSHTIPDRYRARQVLTHEGQVVVGMPIYESVDGVTLMTADAKTQRINTEDIAEIQDASTSLMPEGLLDGLSEQQVADLLAYLKSL